jgi:hypothetical protein
VEILLVAERVEAKKDWNKKPGEPFGENALIIFEVIFIILCIETKNQNLRLHKIALKIQFYHEILNQVQNDEYLIYQTLREILNQVQNDGDLVVTQHLVVMPNSIRHLIYQTLREILNQDQNDGNLFC